MNPADFQLTPHSALRWLERSHLIDQVRTEIAAAIPYGGQCGEDTYYLTPAGLVLVVSKSSSGEWIIKTVLTQSQAIANMSMRGIYPESLPASPMLQV